MTTRRLGPARTLATAATTLVLALAITACGGDDESADTPDTSASSSDSTTPAIPPPTSAESTGVPPATPSPDPSTDPSTTPSTEPTGPATSDVPGLPTTPEADAAADDWVLALDELVDADQPAKLRAAHIDGGSDLISSIPDLDRRIAGATLAFKVSVPQVDGNDGNGQVDVTSDGTPAGVVIGVRFARVDGTWRLTRDGACLLASLVGLHCP